MLSVILPLMLLLKRRDKIMEYMKGLKYEIRKRFQHNYKLYEKVMTDCNKWFKDEYSIPATKELRQIIDDITKRKI